MQSTDSLKMVVHFATERRDDGGLRIYATEPPGLYVSSESTYAAAEYFQNMAPAVIARQMAEPVNKILSMEMGFEWEDAVAAGGGMIEFEFLEPSAGELAEMERRPAHGNGDFPRKIGGEPEFAEIGLEVVKRDNGKGRFLVIQDPGEPDPQLEEIIRRQETLQ